MASARPPIETVNDMKLWIAAHDARIDAYWEAQHRWNDKMELKLHALGLRLGAVEKRVMWIAGACAGAGAGVGSVLGVLLSKIF